MNIPSELLFTQCPNGPMANFQYVIGCASTKEVAVVDPAWDVNLLSQEAQKLGTVTMVLLTHGHMDHVNGLEAFLSKHNVPAYMNIEEASFYRPKHKNLKDITDGNKIKIGNIELDVIWTPGHSPGSTCFRYKNVLITGDLVFIDGCGRCDLPGSDPKKQYHSLHNILCRLPDDTQIFPGHDYGPVPYDLLGRQKKSNPYLAASSMQEFLQERMGISY